LNAPASDQRRVQFAKNIRQRQRDQHTVAIILRRKNIRGSLAQLPERNFDGPAGQLCENLFQGHCDGSFANIAAPDAGL
jgi:hypothetical protein